MRPHGERAHATVPVHPVVVEPSGPETPELSGHDPP
jgi:hypothetical protein